ncbi:Kinesin protein 3 [Phytophthora nicotianae]|uniref:Kinesin protein 3 n=1 Tax=Phytophthora nicotianae TaxID=4792 RepID=A0A0W8CJ69_PHYNI|nr:Kinesin protein 3 [Phytophthora nicotianae]
MERAHVLIRLRGDASSSGAVGICRMSATTVRLEHSEMSPGVASITFEQVFDVNDSNSRVFQTSLTGAIDDVVGGRAVTLIATGATSAGKSFACHGDQHKPSNGKAEPGLITLAIRRVFSGLVNSIKDGEKCNVLLSCWGAQSGNNEALMDLLADGTSVDMKDMEKVMVDRSVVVKTPAEAVHLYSKALGRLKDTQKQDFVFALHVETLLANGEARRGRLIVIDIDGGSIIEPRGEQMYQTQKKNRGEYFLDPQFSVNETLSAGFGAFVGNTSSTYLLVAIQTPAQFQQQAIQSLLYACKAKEIKSSSAINYLSEYVERNSSNQLLETGKRLSKDAENQAPGCREDVEVPKAPQIYSAEQRANLFSSGALPPVSPPLSTTSSGSTCEPPFIAPRAREPVDSPSLSPSTSCESEESLKQSAVSKRLRKAYDIAKAATSSPLKRSIVFAAGSNQSDESTAHAAIDELLKHLPHDTLRGLSLQAKLEQIRATQAELERALAHEVSIKDKCVDRISRLSQAMSCQVVEHEQQLHEALTAKHTAESQLQDLTIKFDDVGHEVTRLQEEAMIQAKDVITFKDGVIQSLEERLQLASKRGADTIALLEQERGQFEREKADLLTQLHQSQGSNTTQLTLELETARSQWAQDVRDREDRAEKRCAKQVAQAEQQLEQATTAMQQQMAQFRDELDMKLARQRVAAQVACKAGEVKCEQLERELQRMKQKLAKQKMKMEKKARVLVANAHKEHEEPVALLKRGLEDLSERLIVVVEREQEAIRRAEKSEEAVERFKADIQKLKTTVCELERERTALGNLYKELDADKDAVKADFELRSREMEEALAQQIMAAEARVNKERDDEVQKLIKQHDTEMNRLQTEAREREQSMVKEQLGRQQSSSESSEGGSLTSNNSHQKRIEELDALIDSKERRYRHLEKRKKAGRSSSSSPPTKKTTSSLKKELAHKEEKIAELSIRQKQLLVALATANEQETRAKQQVQETKSQRQSEVAQYEDLLQQLNCLKRENWNLSLALQVTEASRHQQ